MKPSISVFVPTLDAGDQLAALLDVLRRQRDVDLEILITDSSSQDERTRAILASSGLAYETIARRDFNHGETRNAAARRAQGEFVAFLSQDALPLHDDYLFELQRPFVNPQVAGSFAAQFPEARAHPFQLVNLARHMDESAGQIIRPPIAIDEWNAMSPAERVERIRFDDVASMIRKSDLLARPFPRRDFAEDLAWARASLLAGRALAFCPAAGVRHSHALSRAEFGARTAEVHAALRELCDFVPMPGLKIYLRRIAGTCLRFQAAALKVPDRALFQRVGDLISAPYWALLQMTAMRRGSLGARYRAPERDCAQDHDHDDDPGDAHDEA